MLVSSKLIHRANRSPGMARSQFETETCLRLKLFLVLFFFQICGIDHCISVLRITGRISVKIRTNTGTWQHCKTFAWQKRRMTVRLHCWQTGIRNACKPSKHTNARTAGSIGGRCSSALHGLVVLDLLFVVFLHSSPKSMRAIDENSHKEKRNDMA